MNIYCEFITNIVVAEMFAGVCISSHLGVELNNTIIRNC